MSIDRLSGMSFLLCHLHDLRKRRTCVRLIHLSTSHDDLRKRGILWLIHLSTSHDLTIVFNGPVDHMIMKMSVLLLKAYHKILLLFL